MDNSIIDCDLHVRPPHADAIKSLLDKPWRDYFKFMNNVYYPRPAAAGERNPAAQAQGATDPETVRREWIEPNGIRHAILVPETHISAYPNADHCVALASAYNRWLAESWLETDNDDGVFKGSILISHRDPAAAAAEIDRWAGHPHMVQAVMETGSRAPLGQKEYYPIYEACERHGLPLALHPGSDGLGVNQPAAPGHPTYYVEYYAGLSLTMQAHLVSIVTEGVFVRCPKLRLVIAEGGFLWLPALMWRLDQEYKALRSEVPWLTRKPGEYVRDHVRFTSYPVESSPDASEWEDMLRIGEAERMLMYSGGYPFDLAAPQTELGGLPQRLRERICFANADEWYVLFKASATGE